MNNFDFDPYYTPHIRAPKAPCCSGGAYVPPSPPCRPTGCDGRGCGNFGWQEHCQTPHHGFDSGMWGGKFDECRDFDWCEPNCFPPVCRPPHHQHCCGPRFNCCGPFVWLALGSMMSRNCRRHCR